MKSKAKSYRLGAIVLAVVVIPFWCTILWLTEFWALCASLWARLASLPLREFFNQPVSQNDLMIVVPWMLRVVCAIRQFARSQQKSVLKINMMRFGDPENDFRDPNHRT